jgi:putative ABC transport system permease protein
LLGTNLTLGLFKNWYTIPGLILFTVIVGFLSGSYPALFLSSFNPYDVLKGSVRNSQNNGRLRRILVVFQFAVSILLIIGTLIMYRQINYMINKDVGFNKDQVIVINRAEAVGGKMKSFKETIKNIPGVVNISSSTAVPGRINNNNGYMIEGRKDETFLAVTNWADYNFLETYGMTMVSGRNFNESYSSDQQACLINETAKKDFNITDIEKARFMNPDDSGKITYIPVIGVVKNFNFESLRNPIGPYLIRFQNEGMVWGYISVRLSPQNISKTISAIEKVWKEYVSNNPLQYYFVDEDFEKMYIQEKQNAQMSVSGIFFVISREVLILVSISALIAWPLIYYIAGKWLENFYYRINPGIVSLFAGLAIALGIALFTISYRIMKAASVNPAQSLKYE